MAKLGSIATGNFTTAGTWGVIDATLYLNSETSTVTVPTAYGSSARSPNQTPGAITVSHIGIKLATRSGTTGTITVHLALNGSFTEVAGTAVTINMADLPNVSSSDLNGGWHFFKLATPVTLAGATAYVVEVKTSSSSQAVVHASGATNGLSSAVITTTTQAPAAGDDLFINCEYTGTGTSNTFTVTMDETATTDYGAASTSLVTPAIALSNGGTLSYGTTAATNYYLKVSGNIIGYSGSTFLMGNVGAECPRDSTMKLLLDCAANVDFGITIRNGSTFKTQGLSRTSGYNIYYCKLNTDEAVNSTALGVDTDTKWLDNDEIVVASTTRTTGDTEKGALNGAAGASSLTVDGFGGAGGGLAAAHSGSSPTQAEVMLLTRNVSVFGTSTSLQAYIDIKATATVDCDWTEFYNLGSGTASKRGIDIATSSGHATFRYCTFRNFEVSGSVIQNTSSTTNADIVFQYCNFYRISQSMIAGTQTGTNLQSIDSCLFFSQLTTASAVFSFFSYDFTFTNNIVAGCLCMGGIIGTGSTGTAGSAANFDNNLFHSNAAPVFGGSNIKDLVVTNLTIYRHNSSGIVLSSLANPTFTNITIFGCSSSCISLANGVYYLATFINGTFNGDSSFSTASGITHSSNAGGLVKFINCNFGTVTGIKTGHTTGDIACGGVQSSLIVMAINTILASHTEVSQQTNLQPYGFISSQKHDQTAGLHKMWRKYGNITIETTTVRTGGKSMKLTPNDASSRLETMGPDPFMFRGFEVPILNGQACTPSIYVYEDGSYNGARARLILKRNDALGISADTVIDTATAASDGAWEQLTGTTAAVTDDGVLVFVVDCNGTAGNLYVDDFSYTNA